MFPICFCFFLSYHTSVYVFQKEYSEDGVSHMNLLQLCWKKKKEAKTIFNSDHEFCNEFKKNSLPLNMKFLFLSKKNRLMHKSLI